MSRKLMVCLFVVVAWSAVAAAAVLPEGGESDALSPVPVILDTDIGGDVDDTWALAYLLRSPELDLKLVVTDSGDTVYRARVAARLLEVAGRSDVPVAIGIRQSEDGGPQGEWVAGYDLESYPGTIHEDGVQALIDAIRGSETPITVIAIGPAPNLKVALERAPDIAQRARFVGMYGSVRLGYDGKPEPAAEWNVRADPSAVQAIFAAPWEVTITPLDTCGTLKLTDERYASVRDSQDPLAQAIIDNYRLWLPHIDWLPDDPTLPERESTTLFDIVAVYLAFSEEWVEIEEVGLEVTDEGHTVEDPSARAVRGALRWKDRAALEEQIVARLTGTAGDKPAAGSLEELEAEILEILDDHNVPAASVALVDRDEVLWAAGVGVADRASGRAATADTLFRVGSITKSFTSLAVLRFVEDGRLRLDDPVRDLVPDVAFENRWTESDPILLAHLLEHTTGFDDIHLPEYAHNQGDPPVTLSQGLAFHPHSRISRWRPGRYMSYCNAGPGMAGAVLEKLAGRPFEEIAGERVLRPLGMTAATLLEPAGDQRATGYQAGGEIPGEYWHITTRPSGALNASAREMAGLIRMFLNRGAVDGVQVWQPSSIDRMEQPSTTASARAGLAAGYGLASYVVQHEGFVWHGHSGGMNTFVADYAYNKQHGVGFYASINVANGRVLRGIRNALRGYLTRGLRPSPSPAVDVAAADLAEVEGSYRDFTPRQELGRFLGAYFGIAVVRHRGGQLYVGSAFDRGDRLLPLGSRRFRGDDDGRASWVYVPGTEDGDLLLGRQT